MGVREVFFKRGEEGFTTVGSAVALLLAFVLAFGAVQTHWVQARSGQVQYVADAAALAADGAVAELVVYAQAIDAALLSFSLLGLCSSAASGVAAFVPGGQGVAEALAELSSRVFKTRDSFAQSAQKGLSAAYQALPALCTTRAIEVLEANAQASGQEYWGVAVPLPLYSGGLELGDDSAAEEAASSIEEQEGQVEDEVARQEEATKRMDEAKEAAWRADCGDDACMRERAQTLAGLSGADNPSYSSADTWSFAVGLARAERYYRARYQQEEGASYEGGPEEVAQSVARKAFYRYARREVSKGSVAQDVSGAEQVDLKSLARNTEQMRGTFLYTETAYPLSMEGGVTTLHAWDGCPGYQAGTAAGLGSLEELDQGLLAQCPECSFSIRTIGKVPLASTAIDNGFEYHYRLLVEASQDYAAAANELRESTAKLQEAAASMQQSFKEGLSSLASARMDIQPPGRYGCVVIVVAGDAEASIGASFITEQAQVGARIAISAACLAPDEAVDQSQVLQGIGAGLVPLDGLASGLAKTLFGAWGSALAAYSSGVEGIQNTLESVLGSIPLVGTELSQWVGEGFSAVVEECGLEPAELVAYKPVLCASDPVLEADGGALAQGLLKAKQGAEYASQVSMGDLSQVLALLESVDMGDPGADDAGKIALAGISLLAGGLGAGGGSIEMELGEDAVKRFAQAVSQVKGVL